MKNNLYFRIFIFVISIILCAIGTVISTLAALGTAPIATLPLVVTYLSPLSFGFTTFCFNVIFIILQIILLGKKFPPKYYFQLLTILIFSVFIDIFMFLLKDIIMVAYIAKLLYLILGSFILALGLFLEVKADIMLMPGDGLTKVISDKYNKNFGKVKVAFDFALCIFAILLSLIGLHSLKGIGEGTIISALLVGNFVKVFISVNNRFKLI